MPLSKKRMRVRKRQDRFDKRQSSPQHINPVKPKPRGILFGIDKSTMKIPELDADGEVIYENV